VSEPAGLLVIDLDGTLCLGDAPVRAYGRHAAEAAGDPALVERLDAFLDGRESIPGAGDGYQAVAALARAAGVEQEDIGAAFMRSREGYAEWVGEVSAPEGVVELLGGLDGVRRVLVTNAPPPGLRELLAGIGVAPVLDSVVTAAGKPKGMPAVLDRLQLTTPGAALASLGDIWANDHAEVHARGGATFLIDRHGLGEGRPTARGARIEELYPAIEEWARARRG